MADGGGTIRQDIAVFKPMPIHDVERKLRAEGFRLDSQNPQKKYIKETSEGRRTVKVPCHRDVPAGTLKKIIQRMGLSPEEFERL